MNIARSLWGMAVACLLVSGMHAGAQTRITRQTSPYGDEYGYIARAKPGPLAILLTTTIDDALGGEHTSAGEALARAGFVLASIDAPCHGNDMPGKTRHLLRPPAAYAGAGEGLRCWARQLEASEADIFEPFLLRASRVITDMARRQLITGDRILVLGVSRGGYLALRVAAADERVTDVVALAPVTDLGRLTEFLSVKVNPSVYGLDRFTQQLSHRHLFLQIGSADPRVGTHAVLQLVDAISAAGHGASIDMTLVVTPGAGHLTAEHERAAQWAIDGILRPPMRAKPSPPPPS